MKSDFAFPGHIKNRILVQIPLKDYWCNVLVVPVKKPKRFWRRMSGVWRKLQLDRCWKAFHYTDGDTVIAHKNTYHKQNEQSSFSGSRCLGIILHKSIHKYLLQVITLMKSKPSMLQRSVKLDTVDLWPLRYYATTCHWHVLHMMWSHATLIRLFCLASILPKNVYYACGHAVPNKDLNVLFNTSSEDDQTPRRVFFLTKPELVNEMLFSVVSFFFISRAKLKC